LARVIKNFIELAEPVAFVIFLRIIEVSEAIVLWL
jgi:hypothetical protein